MTEEQGIARRTLLKTGAWAAPVILVAAAAPAAAASTNLGTIAVTRLWGRYVKETNSYALIVEVANDTKEERSITIVLTTPDGKPELKTDPEVIVVVAPPGGSAETKADIWFGDFEKTTLTATPTLVKDTNEITFKPLTAEVIYQKDFDVSKKSDPKETEPTKDIAVPTK